MASRARTEFGHQLQSAIQQQPRDSQSDPQDEPVAPRYAPRSPRWGKSRMNLSLVRDERHPGVKETLEAATEVRVDSAVEPPQTILSAQISLSQPKGNFFMEAAELMSGRAKQAISIIATEIEGIRSRKTVLQIQLDELAALENTKMTDVKRIQDHMIALEMASSTAKDIKDLLSFEEPKKGVHREVSHASINFTSRVLEDFLKGLSKRKFTRADVLAGLGDKISSDEICKTFSQRVWYLVQQGRAQSVSRGVFTYQG